VSGEAENGQEAIDKAECLKPDMIIFGLVHARHEWTASSGTAEKNATEGATYSFYGARWAGGSAVG
jgi:hypothetical protein